MTEESVILESKLDQRQVSLLFDALKRLAGQPIILDARKVTYLGGQCAQLIVAAERKWMADGISFTILSSESFLSAVKSLGLAKEMRLEEGGE
jgi:anti-anti-sigma regulatory factor